MQSLYNVPFSLARPPPKPLEVTRVAWVISLCSLSLNPLGSSGSFQPITLMFPRYSTVPSPWVFPMMWINTGTCLVEVLAVLQANAASFGLAQHCWRKLPAFTSNAEAPPMQCLLRVFFSPQIFQGKNDAYLMMNFVISSCPRLVQPTAICCFLPKLPKWPPGTTKC